MHRCLVVLIHTKTASLFFEKKGRRHVLTIYFLILVTMSSPSFWTNATAPNMCKNSTVTVIGNFFPDRVYACEFMPQSPYHYGRPIFSNWQSPHNGTQLGCVIPDIQSMVVPPELYYEMTSMWLTGVEEKHADNNTSSIRISATSNLVLPSHYICIAPMPTTTPPVEHHAFMKWLQFRWKLFVWSAVPIIFVGQ